MRRVFKEDIYILGLLNIYTANNKSLASALAAPSAKPPPKWAATFDTEPLVVVATVAWPQCGHLIRVLIFFLIIG